MFGILVCLALMGEPTPDYYGGRVHAIDRKNGEVIVRQFYQGRAADGLRKVESTFSRTRRVVRLKMSEERLKMIGMSLDACRDQDMILGIWWDANMVVSTIAMPRNDAVDHLIGKQ